MNEEITLPSGSNESLLNPTKADRIKEIEQIWTSRIRLAARATAFVSGTVLIGTAIFQAIWVQDLPTASTLATVGGGLLTIALTGKQE